MRAVLRRSSAGEAGPLLLHSITQQPGHEDLQTLLRRAGIDLRLCHPTHVSQDGMLKPALAISLDVDPARLCSRLERPGGVRAQSRADGSVLVEF